MEHRPVVFGSVGLGGFASSICQKLLRHSRREHPVIKLWAVCEPEIDRHAERAAMLRQAGVKVCREFQELMDEPIEAVWLPLPIDLHRSFTEAALAAGKAVMCEKPAAGCVDDVDAMIAARNRFGLPVAIGFQDVYQPEYIELKRRLLSGELGRPRSVSVVAAWPRSDVYYHRTAWAGRWKRNGVWVCDSPASNALAHYIHLVLYLLGDSPEAPAAPQTVEAELYRANSIETYDTCMLRVQLSGGVPMLVALTHACAEALEPIVRITTDAAAIEIFVDESMSIHRPDGRSEATKLQQPSYGWVIDAFAARVRGDPSAPPGATLETARAHLVVVNAAAEACPVTQIPPEEVQTVPADGGGHCRTIRGIVPMLERCAQREQLLHESAQARWSAPAGRIDVRDYRHFAGPAAGT